MKVFKAIIGWAMAVFLSFLYTITVGAGGMVKLSMLNIEWAPAAIILALSCLTAAIVTARTRGWWRIVLLTILTILSITCIFCVFKVPASDLFFETLTFVVGTVYVVFLTIKTRDWQRLVFPPLFAIAWCLYVGQVLPPTSSAWWPGAVVFLAASFLIGVTVAKTRGLMRGVLLPVQVTVSALCVWQTFVCAWRFLPARDTEQELGMGLVIMSLLALLLFFLVSFIVVVNSLLRSRDPRGYVRAVILTGMTIAAIPLMKDDPPPEDGYTDRDILSTWPQADETRTVLYTYQAGSTNVLWVKAPNTAGQTPSNISIYANEVTNAWNAIAGGREVIAKLDSFDRIADMTKPEHVALNAPMVSYVSYRNICHTYWSYAQLRTEQGAPEEGAQMLVQLYSVARKGLPEMGQVVTKMLWVAVAGGTIQRAYLVASHPKCTPEATKILRDGFQPLDRDSVSLRRIFIGEYLAIQKTIAILTQSQGERYLNEMMYPRGARELSKVELGGLKLVTMLTCKPHMTARDHLRIIRLEVASDRMTPPDFGPVKEHMDNYVASPRFRNVAGWWFINAAIGSYAQGAETAFANHIRSQLLSIYLNQRLGREVTMDDPFTGKPYSRDAQGVPFSVGRDGVANTQDDIGITEKVW